MAQVSERKHTPAHTNLGVSSKAFTLGGAGVITPESGGCWVITALILTSTVTQRNTSETHTQNY